MMGDGATILISTFCLLEYVWEYFQIFSCMILEKELVVVLGYSCHEIINMIAHLHFKTQEDFAFDV